MRGLYALAGIVVLGLTLSVGLVFFAGFALVAIVLGAIIWVRLWWATRKIRAEMKSQRPAVIDGEFVIVDAESDDDSLLIESRPIEKDRFRAP